MSTDETVTDLLARYRRVAIVGASPKTDRPSYGVMRRLLAKGLDVVPVNPGCDEILGVRCAADLEEAAARGPLEIVDVFRRPSDVPGVVDEAIAAGAKAIWMQSGIRSPEGAATAREAGLQVVEDRCIAVELGRLASSG